MSFPEDEVKRLAELREWLVKQIAEKEEEVERLKITLGVIDSSLKQQSFKPAVMLSQKSGRQETEYGEERQIKTKDNVILANAYTATKSITIIPVLEMSISTPPFQSFFLNKILEGMKEKDRQRVSSGELEPNDVIEYKIDDESGMIRKIIVNNYRNKERLNEIINTAAWVFARMLEKTR